jgi:hypothetical protein
MLTTPRRGAAALVLLAMVVCGVAVVAARADGTGMRPCVSREHLFLNDTCTEVVGWSYTDCNGTHSGWGEQSGDHYWFEAVCCDNNDPGCGPESCFEEGLYPPQGCPLPTPAH